MSKQRKIIKGAIVSITCQGFMCHCKGTPIVHTGKVLSIQGNLIKVAVIGYTIAHYFFSSQLKAI